jgi:hypothetical protein
MALAIMPLIGGVALASAPAMFVCRGDRVARATCCCPGGERVQAPSGQTAPSISAACCCDVSKMSAPITPVAEPRVAPPAIERIVLAPLTGAAVVSSPPSARGGAAFNLAHAPPSATPILLSKQSFLL